MGDTAPLACTQAPPSAFLPAVQGQVTIAVMSCERSLILGGWLGLLLLPAFVSAGESSLAVQKAGAPGPRILFSTQTGVGRVEESPATLLQPRLLFEGRHAVLSLSLPLWLRLGKKGTSGRWLTRWDQIDTYGAVVEALAVETPKGSFQLYGGSLSEETSGYGVLVDGYSNEQDPLRPRSGLRADLRGESLAAWMMLDSLVDPHTPGPGGWQPLALGESPSF